MHDCGDLLNDSIEKKSLYTAGSYVAVALHLKLLGAVSCGDIKGVEKLFAEGAWPNSFDTRGLDPAFVGDFSTCTPLGIAVMRNKKEMVDFLISKGAKVDGRDLTGCSPLVIAVQNGCEDMVDVLLRFDVDISRALGVARESRDVAIREKLEKAEKLKTRAQSAGLGVIEAVVSQYAQKCHGKDVVQVELQTDAYKKFLHFDALKVMPTTRAVAQKGYERSCSMV